MSKPYSHEPRTEGKVVFRTSGGDVDIELWPRAAPKACRNFVQLCLEGYFDGTVFHRVLEGRLIQGGDPTATGAGGESVYGRPFEDEFHSRLKFSHRGMVAMANDGLPNSNKSQFFITLDACTWLNKKHTIFGKIDNKTIFNVIEMSKTELGTDDRPLFPPKILSAAVLFNPFDDITPRTPQLAPAFSPKKEAMAPKAAKMERNKALLSFAVGDDDDQDDAPRILKKVASAHDAFKKDVWNQPLERLLKERCAAEKSFEAAPSPTAARAAEEGRAEKSLADAEKGHKTAENSGNEPEKATPAKSQAEQLRAEYRKAKNELIRSRRRARKLKTGLLGWQKRTEKEKPATALEKNLAKYKKREMMSKDEREANTLSRVREFSKTLHKMANAFSKKHTDEQLTAADLAEDDEYWLRDGRLCFNELPPSLHKFKLDDYVVKQGDEE